MKKSILVLFFVVISAWANEVKIEEKIGYSINVLDEVRTSTSNKSLDELEIDTTTKEDDC